MKDENDSNLDHKVTNARKWMFSRDYCTTLFYIAVPELRPSCYPTRKTTACQYSRILQPWRGIGPRL